MIIKMINAVRSRGAGVVARRAYVRLARKFGHDLSDPYLDWIEDHTPRRAELAAQRRWSLEREDDFPRFGLLVRTDGRSSRDLDRTLRSLRRQTYHHWTHWTHATASNGAAGRIIESPVFDYLGVMEAGDCLS